MALTRDTPLTALPGVGPQRGKKLEKLGLRTLGDALGHLPQRYEDRRACHALRDAPEGVPCCVTAMVAATPTVYYPPNRRGLSLVKVRAVDEASTVNITFFNQDYIREVMSPGQTYVFFGVVERGERGLTMTNPSFEREGEGRLTGLILPVYPLTAGISNNLMAGLTRRAVDACVDGLPEALPGGLRAEHGLCPVEDAWRQIHYPADFEKLEAARRRLVFEELFVLTCGLAQIKKRRSRGSGRVLAGEPEEFSALLPFAPTGAQRRAMEDIAADLRSGRAMSRLVQGDVGSGKTAVAAFGAWTAAKNGAQCALMAPTELLAEQHARTLEALLAPAGVRVALLTGSVKGREKKALLSALAAGEIDLLVGTHALFSPGVEYRDLGLVIADEQHRFGVAQRAALAAKGEGDPARAGTAREAPYERFAAGKTSAQGEFISPEHFNDSGAPGRAEGPSGELPPHVLVMSATPIPRTLALVLYGDLDVSVMDELPPGRTPVKTVIAGEHTRQRMYGFVRKQVGEGRQVYIVCPSVEENGGWEDGACMDLKAVTAYAKELRERVFPDLRVGFVHGRLKPADKEAVMSAFAGGELDVLVSTTVIEVGVDVPNASLMIIENAERFGLSQLHQLRGRVGRGKHESWCVLMSSSRGGGARERLEALRSTNDGFRIAEEDLRLRGPGDFFGKRQHGAFQLKAANLADNLALLKEAQAAAAALVEADPELENPEYALLKEKVRRLFEENAELFN